MDNTINFNLGLILLHFSPMYKQPPHSSPLLWSDTGKEDQISESHCILLPPPSAHSQNATSLVQLEGHQDRAHTAGLTGSSHSSMLLRCWQAIRLKSKILIPHQQGLKQVPYSIMQNMATKQLKPQKMKQQIKLLPPQEVFLVPQSVLHHLTRGRNNPIQIPCTGSMLSRFECPSRIIGRN